ncbi:(d)CMP kinase [Synoicihabitans lomoniglobus]|uniref:Cytidylate kinase n=1 Tax=Synoicihabitans lomoniglobus TaxID=2909285 RepID=A0AAE9ZUI3_9BACT|nr:(d)CMP kinase [Opitutaceae bacterium LMO-M01]WED63294.1 (d)CMP kinase [Opitutaceae bacterium LMO-M01]
MTEASFIIVAIDGGAASGKSSTSRALSARFNLLHVDTGSFYRTMTAELLRVGVSADDADGIGQAAAALPLDTAIEGRRASMCINGRIVPDAEIRTSEVNANVSIFAAVPELRRALLDYQRNLAAVAREHGFPGLVMEGRDIGSVIFPDADFRFFLHADPAERARRRAAEGQTDSIAERDRLDTSRKTAPLACPEGATDIDSTFMTLEEVVERISGDLATRLSPVS